MLTAPAPRYAAPVSRDPRQRAATLAVLAALALALTACGDDAPPAAAARTPEPPRSAVCDLIPGEPLTTILPGATVDTSFQTDDTCAITADAGDLLVSAIRTSSFPKSKRVNDIALGDAKANGAGDLRKADGLGPNGVVATNAADGEITVVWRRDGVAYSLQYSGWEDDAQAAGKRAEYLANQAQPLP